MTQLTRTIRVLKPQQIRELYGVMLDAAVAHEITGCHRDVFRRAKYRKVGALRRVYETLEHASYKQIEAMSRSLEDTCGTQDPAYPASTETVAKATTLTM